MNGASNASQDVEQQALDWYLQARNGLDAVQRQALQQWLRDPAHRQAYARWGQDWHALDATPAEAVDRLRQGWQPQGRQMPRRLLLLGGMGLAACTVLGVGLAVRHRQGALSSDDYATAPGQTRSVVLADGSQIELDTATRLTVARYADHDALDLQQGQAWFDLRRADASTAQDSGSHGYRILAGALQLTAAGAMSVRHTPAPPGQGSVHVAVAAGHVHMARMAAWSDWLPGRRAASQQAIDLYAGQQGWAGDDEPDWRIQPIALQDVAAWRQGRLVVQDMTLDQVLAEFARYGHVVPRIADARVARLRVAGSFDLRQPTAFYRLLPQILPVRIAAHGQEQIIVMLQGA